MGGVFIMKAKLDMNIDGFLHGISSAITNVGRGTKKATTEAIKTIYEESLAEVPRETNTLAESADYEIYGKSPKFGGRVTYGVTKNPINPETKQPASKYAVVVHEDLGAWHLTGKAKFLEDPILRYAQQFPISYKRILKQFLGG